MFTIAAQELKKPFNIAIVASRFYYDIVEKLCNGAVERLKELQFNEQDITIVWVPGIEEVPLLAQRLAEQGKYEAIVCLGVVIRGETDIYDYVCQQASFGCQKVALEKNIPVIFGVLPTKNTMQALARAGGVHGHKGREAIDAAYEMISVLQQLDKT
jgi:6,7-dimethyl-8-ribityllumazine synthase